jgi:hypothetical protein
MHSIGSAAFKHGAWRGLTFGMVCTLFVRVLTLSYQAPTAKVLGPPAHLRRFPRNLRSGMFPSPPSGAPLPAIRTVLGGAGLLRCGM